VPIASANTGAAPRVERGKPSSDPVKPWLMNWRDGNACPPDLVSAVLTAPSGAAACPAGKREIPLTISAWAGGVNWKMDKLKQVQIVI